MSSSLGKASFSVEEVRELLGGVSRGKLEHLRRELELDPPAPQGPGVGRGNKAMWPRASVRRLLRHVQAKEAAGEAAKVTRIVASARSSKSWVHRAAAEIIETGPTSRTNLDLMEMSIAEPSPEHDRARLQHAVVIALLTAIFRLLRAPDVVLSVADLLNDDVAHALLDDGATSQVACVARDRVVLASAGDAIALLGGEPFIAIPMREVLVEAQAMLRRGERRTRPRRGSNAKSRRP